MTEKHDEIAERTLRQLFERMYFRNFEVYSEGWAKDVIKNALQEAVEDAVGVKVVEVKTTLGCVGCGAVHDRYGVFRSDGKIYCSVCAPPGAEKVG